MEIQFSSLKNETVIFIIPLTINTITIHVFKILSSIIPNYFQCSFDRCGLTFDSSIPFLTFTFYTVTHKLVPSNYYRPLTKTQLKLHKEIERLQNKGLSSNIQSIHSNPSSVIGCLFLQVVQNLTFLSSVLDFTFPI